MDMLEELKYEQTLAYLGAVVKEVQTSPQGKKPKP